MAKEEDGGWRERLGINFDIDLSDSDIDDEPTTVGNGSQWSKSQLPEHVTLHK